MNAAMLKEKDFFPEPQFLTSLTGKVYPIHDSRHEDSSFPTIQFNSMTDKITHVEINDLIPLYNKGIVVILENNVLLLSQAIPELSAQRAPPLHHPPPRRPAPALQPVRPGGTDGRGGGGGGDLGGGRRRRGRNRAGVGEQQWR